MYRSLARTLFWISRLIVGGIFLYAGVLKAMNPLDFADSIAAYNIFPNDLIDPLARGLPFFEIACGLSVSTGVGLRMGTIGIAGMLIAFIGAITIALAKGLKIDCGCFGGNSWLESNLWIALGRDAVLLLLAVFIYWYRLRQNLEQPFMDQSASSER